MKQIPNLFTLLNLVFGCLAIVFVLEAGVMIISDVQGNDLLYIPEKIWYASLFIGLAAIVDFLDGFVARLFKASSEMGKQLDSLADLVSFGVAPGLILYHFLRLAVAHEPDGMDSFVIWLLPAFIIPAAAAWRLARFNLDKSQSHSFKGLPVPATGLVVASLPLIYWNVNESWVQELLLNKWFLYGLIFLLSWLMISTIPLMALKFSDFGFKKNFPKYLVILIAVLSIIVFKWLAAPIIVLAYVILSLLFKKQTA
ncbi:MAG TPA: CDP-alcohol phosphatidyltransferase family protein [Chitinophagaceae bacterium]|nr:CDP-alcohol phosphatidyltransferase family protein [Chitinophagaceae bacterium]